MKKRKVEIKREKLFQRPIKVAWYSNDPVMPTGYSKVTREVCSRLANDPRFEVFVLAEGYSGAPKRFMNFMVYGTGSIQNPISNLVQHLKIIKPDVLVALEDTFTLFNQQMHTVNFGNIKFIVYTPMDGKWIPTSGHAILRRCDKIVSMADYTHKILKKEGFDSEIIWHGVDLHGFHPIDNQKKLELRRLYNIPEDKFVFFNFGRNSMRKFNHRLIHVLARVFQKIPNSIALLNLMHYNARDLNLEDYLDRHIKIEFGQEIVDRFLLNKKLKVGSNMQSVTDQDVMNMMMLSDMVISTSTGEGSGLIMPETMACMKPIIHTDYSTPYEWLIEERDGIGPRGILVPCKDKVVSSYNVEHGHVDEDKFVEAVIDYYQNVNLQEQHIKNGRLFVERYANWDYLVEKWKNIFFKMV